MKIINPPWVEFPGSLPYDPVWRTTRIDYLKSFYVYYASIGHDGILMRTYMDAFPEPNEWKGFWRGKDQGMLFFLHAPPWSDAEIAECNLPPNGYKIGVLQ